MKPQSIAYGPQAAFLANSANKSQLLKLLAYIFTDSGHQCPQAPADGDCLVVQSAMESCADEVSVIVADDTDILVLAMHHFREEYMELYIYSETSARSKNSFKYISIRELWRQVGPVVCSHILFIHAWTGCDTTSAIHGYGKTFA